MNPWQPTLTSPRLVLRPQVAEDFAALFSAASDPGIWEQHPDPLRWQRDRFEAYFRGALESQGGLVALAPESRTIIGCSRFYDWDRAARTIVIGYTFLARAHWGTGLNAEMKRLMLDHAFRHVDTAYFHVGPDNLRSQRALDKIGARFEHEAEVLVSGTRSRRRVYRIDAPPRPEGAR